jgi:hypothetical protein
MFVWKAFVCRKKMSLFVAWFKANGVDPAEKHCLTDLASRDLMGQG